MTNRITKMLAAIVSLTLVIPVSYTHLRAHET